MRKQLFFKYIKSNKGNFSLNLILILIFIIGGTFLFLEYANAVTIGDKINKHLDRAVNSAVKLSMMDNYRQDHISKIDTDLALQEFYSYMTNVAGFDSTMTYRDGPVEYELFIEDINLQSEPPVFEVKGTLKLTPLFFKDIVPTKLEIPVKGKAKNIRLD